MAFGCVLITRAWGPLLVSAMLFAAASPKAEAQNWSASGMPYFGVFLQGSMVNYDLTRYAKDGTVFTQTASPNSFGVGIVAGYDWRFGNVILGGVVDASFDGGVDKAKPDNGTQYGVDFLATARARLGYIIAPDIMVYATAGYGAHGVEYKTNSPSSEPATSGTSPIAKKSGTIPGVVYGGGLDYNVGWGIAFVEYLHQDLTTWDFTTLTGGFRRTVEGSQDVVRLGMKFTLGDDRASDVYRRPGAR